MNLPGKPKVCPGASFFVGRIEGTMEQAASRKDGKQMQTTAVAVAKPNREPARRKLVGLRMDEGYMVHPFDADHGVRTSGLVVGRNLKSGHKNDRHSTAYYGIAPSVFRSLMSRWRRTTPLAPLSDYTFIDLGAGMGRAMMLASELPFRAVVGVEMHPTLAGIARRNLTKWRKSGRAAAPIRLHEGDAVDYKLPDGPCAVFLFNPFGAPVLKRLAEGWELQWGCHPGKVDVLYVNHEHELALRMRLGWTRLFAGEVLRSPEDLEAERRILNHQPDGEYAATGWEDCSIFRWGGQVGC